MASPQIRRREDSQNGTSIPLGKVTIENIPHELLSYIFSLIPLVSLGAASFTCRFWHSLVVGFLRQLPNKKLEDLRDKIRANPLPSMKCLPPVRNNPNNPLLFFVSDNSIYFQTFTEENDFQLYVTDNKLIQVNLDNPYLRFFGINPPRLAAHFSGPDEIYWLNSIVKDGLLQICTQDDAFFLNLDSNKAVAHLKSSEFEKGFSQPYRTHPFACNEESLLFIGIHQKIYQYKIGVTQQPLWSSNFHEKPIALIETGLGIVVSLDEGYQLYIWNCQTSTPLYTSTLESDYFNHPFVNRPGKCEISIQIVHTLNGTVVRVTHKRGKMWLFRLDFGHEKVASTSCLTSFETGDLYVTSFHKTHLVAAHIFRNTIRVVQKDFKKDEEVQMELPWAYNSEVPAEIEHFHHFYLKTLGQVLGAMGPDFQSVVLWDLESKTELTTLRCDVRLVTFSIVESGSVVGISSAGEMLVWNFENKEKKLRARRNKKLS